MLQDKVSSIATQLQPSDSLLLLYLDDLSRVLAANSGHQDAPTFQETINPHTYFHVLYVAVKKHQCLSPLRSRVPLSVQPCTHVREGYSVSLIQPLIE